MATSPKTLFVALMLLITTSVNGKTYDIVIPNEHYHMTVTLPHDQYIILFDNISKSFLYYVAEGILIDRIFDYYANAGILMTPEGLVIGTGDDRVIHLIQIDDATLNHTKNRNLPRPPSKFFYRLWHTLSWYICACTNNCKSQRHNQHSTSNNARYVLVSTPTPPPASSVEELDPVG